MKNKILLIILALFALNAIGNQWTFDELIKNVSSRDKESNAILCVKQDTSDTFWKFGDFNKCIIKQIGTDSIEFILNIESNLGLINGKKLRFYKSDSAQKELLYYKIKMAKQDSINKSNDKISKEDLLVVNKWIREFSKDSIWFGMKMKDIKEILKGKWKENDLGDISNCGGGGSILFRSAVLFYNDMAGGVLCSILMNSENKIKAKNKK